MRATAFLLALALCGACSSSSIPPQERTTGYDGGYTTGAGGGIGGGAGGGTGGGGGPTDSGTDGGLDAPLDAGQDAAQPQDSALPACNALVPAGPSVSETLVSGSAPVAAGGTLATGTYWLTAIDVYGSSGETDGGSTGNPPVQRTLVIDATTVQFVEIVGSSDAGPPQSDNTSSTYAIYGTVLSTTETCPAAGGVTNSGFTVSGSQVWLFPSSGNREVYTLQ